MTPDALMMIVATHPLQVLLMGVILFHGARAALSVTAPARRFQVRAA